MGNDEAIIYGDRHGERYNEYPANATITTNQYGMIATTSNGVSSVVEKQFFPNAVKLNCTGGVVSIGIITFDQETGERIYSYGEDECWDSLWTDLNRDGINRLIKELRRLRDRTYGKDE